MVVVVVAVAVFGFVLGVGLGSGVVWWEAGVEGPGVVVLGVVRAFCRGGCGGGGGCVCVPVLFLSTLGFEFRS